ncbi:hypothetical protein Dsin_005125 [Dipteronia sinensis]|uniref:Uncharacterized protein n=1 Tax=Dipteronia sinensis TaxID=43782 RepID=A0AAE0EEB8_9ROSI|nr:hypothetical protein Dsin_005125 [Dipteronia sinensis]
MAGKGYQLQPGLLCLIQSSKTTSKQSLETCLSTLHTGSISLTYYPNFNILLRDNNLHNCLKIQLQLMCITMPPDSYMATLHHQIAYRLQDHALDLPISGHFGDTILIKAEREDEVPTIIQIPKQLPRDQLIELMPLSWITNYEKAFQNTIHIIASDTTYTRQPDGTIKTIYKPLTDVPATHPNIAPSAPPPPDSSNISILDDRTSYHKRRHLIHSFEAYGSAIYTDKINGHFIWDIDPSMCDPNCSCQGSFRSMKTGSTAWIQLSEKCSLISIPGLLISMLISITISILAIMALSLIRKKGKLEGLKAQLEQLQKDQAYSRLPPYKPRVSHSYSMGFPSSPPPSPTQSPYYSHYFKSTGELFRKYPLPNATSKSKPRPTPIVEEPPDAPPDQSNQVPKSRPTNGPWFQLDDSSLNSWRKKISEMSAWLDLQMAKSEQTLEAILREFVSRFTGSLRDWYQALGEYRQLQFVRS